MHSLNNLWLADYAFLNRALAKWADLRGASEQEQPGRPQQGKADIVISGLLLPTVPKLFGVDLREWGFDCTGYDEIAAQCGIAANSKAPGVSMWVSSGGGAVEGIDRALDALRELAQDKQITAHVENMSASAAYWLTTVATEIRANRLAEIGGVGVYVGLYNNSDQKTIVLRSGEFKGAGIDGYTEAQLAAIQERVDDVASEFFSDVAAARPRINMSEIQTGRTWGARKALAMGLIDSIVNASAPGAEPLNAESSANIGDRKMAEKERLEMERFRAQNEALRRKLKGEEAPPAEEEEEEEETPAVEEEEEEKETPAEEEEEAEGEEAPPAEEEEEEEDAKEKARVKKELADLRAEIVKMRKAFALSRGAEPLGNTGGAPASKPRNWAEAVAAIAKRDNIKPSAAGKKACDEYPDLHPAARR